MSMNHWFASLRQFVSQPNAYWAPQLYLLWQAPTPRQCPEKAGEGSWTTASEWAPIREGGGSPNTCSTEKRTAVPISSLDPSVEFSVSLFA